MLSTVSSLLLKRLIKKCLMNEFRVHELVEGPDLKLSTFMKIKLLLLSMLLANIAVAQYAPAGDKIKTRWAEQVSPENALTEYPRPMMVRPEWKNLNGLWQYAITTKGEKAPDRYEGDILVPFCIESSLSGV